MKKKIVIAGGTGFIGKYLQHKLEELDYAVTIISRNKNNVQWVNNDDVIEALENAEMLINLAGKSVDCRYTEKNKKDIYYSRIKTTQQLGEAILKCKNPPLLWINSSTATIYRHAEDRPMTEKNGEIGTGFSVNIATAWEESFFQFALPKTRQVALRMAIVLGKDGGVVRPIKNLVRFGLGGKNGNGHQMFSWIHIEDVFRIIMFLNKNKSIEGVINTAAPFPETNSSFMKKFRGVMKMPFGLSTPVWLLKTGAVMIKTETELILKSRWVLPERLLDAGFKFNFSTLDAALNDILKN
ncbi:MAG: TIGR01777 family oxidoreductase [Ferruginibacter sp.]